MTPGTIGGDTTLTGDARLLFVTRFIRLFAYGALSVVLVFYLVAIGVNEADAGLLLTATLIGDTVISLVLTTQADRLGRRRMLILGAVLMATAGLVFASTHVWWLLLLAGTIGVISPSGHEVGPLLPIEQAALAQLVDDPRRTMVFAWYSLTGSIATALGSLAGGTLVQALLAGCSALLAARLAARIGLINTMVVTHLPSNILLILVPLMPTLPLAISVLLLRFSISQMDVPARQSYVMAVVTPAERSAAAGITGVARTLGAAVSPLFAGALFARPDLIDFPFFIAGGLKIGYDLLLYRGFVSLRPPGIDAS